jgi:ubiquinol-cytochrome c reductase cytochrome b subunit
MRLLRRVWRWFDELTGVSRTVGTILVHPVPPTRKVGWLYVFGSATLVAFAVQVITGTALASGYVTSSGQAYDSLRFITDQPIGRFVRGLHAFGASATFGATRLATASTATTISAMRCRRLSAPSSTTPSTFRTTRA